MGTLCKASNVGKHVAPETLFMRMPQHRPRMPPGCPADSHVDALLYRLRDAFNNNDRVIILTKFVDIIDPQLVVFTIRIKEINTANFVTQRS